MNPANNTNIHENEYFKLRMKEIMGPDWDPSDLPEMPTLGDWHPSLDPPTWTSPNTVPHDPSRYRVRNSDWDQNTIQYNQGMIVDLVGQQIRDLVERYGIHELPRMLDFMKFLLEETELGEHYKIHQAEKVLRGDGGC